ncbi:MAG: hypothetical protein A3K83_06880 [Omnitrophica WOR_2 bacterium RBG_13_44_8b]|nr:MAG: hypothetical protein A3K83_06880 [Omnitrophica WOR_2 bacterium RBG_13_44_8b]
MVAKSIVRVWQEIETEYIEKQLLVAGNTTGDCGNCREIGISLEAKTCPKCGTLFKYMSTRTSNSVKEAKRLRSKRPDLILIDFSDFREAQARKKAHGFLGE